MTGINNTPLTIYAIISPTQFSLTLNTTLLGAYASGGIVTPNLRNVTAALNDYPDTYEVTFINPPQQSVGIAVTWNTSALNFVSAAAVAQLANAALVSYINNIPAGQAINIYQMQSIFAASVSTILAPELLTQLDFLVTIDGVSVFPVTGTGVVSGDPESYFETQTSLITITQGS